MTPGEAQRMAERSAAGIMGWFAQQCLTTWVILPPSMPAETAH